VAGEAVSLSAEAQHRSYPTAVAAVHRTAMSVTSTMRSKLLESEAMHAVSEGTGVQEEGAFLQFVRI
jgi:hypothetical protein